MPDIENDLFTLAMSEKAQPLMDSVKKHIKENVKNSNLNIFIIYDFIRI
jgi:hypothetical protein